MQVVVSRLIYVSSVENSGWSSDMSSGISSAKNVSSHVISNTVKGQNRVFNGYANSMTGSGMTRDASISDSGEFVMQVVIPVYGGMIFEVDLLVEVGV